jgi:hypothetical protein
MLLRRRVFLFVLNGKLAFAIIALSNFSHVAQVMDMHPQLIVMRFPFI